MRYRPSVAGIIRDSSGRVLIGERAKILRGWQFPQGGVEPGETTVQALQREMLEEVSLPPKGYVISDAKGPYRYAFPAGFTKNGYEGQEQQYFLLDLLPGGREMIDVKTRHQEFRRVRWIFPREFEIAWLPRMKRAVYREVLHDFFGMIISGLPEDCN